MEKIHHLARGALDRTATAAVLQTGGLNFASEKGILEKVLRSRPGVLSVEANPVAQTVRDDPSQRLRLPTAADAPSQT